METVSIERAVALALVCLFPLSLTRCAGEITGDESRPSDAGSLHGDVDSSTRDAVVFSGDVADAYGGPMDVDTAVEDPDVGPADVDARLEDEDSEPSDPDATFEDSAVADVTQPRDVAVDITEPDTAEPDAPEPIPCGGFTDVPRDSVYCDAVAHIRSSGITLGCNPPTNTRYCPDAVVSREVMATLLVRALAEVGVTSDANYPCGLSDVSSNNVHRDNICKLRDLGVSRGCNPPSNDRFCPEMDMSRGAMAAFIHRALRGHPTLELPSCTESNYTDVPSDHVFNGDICSLWRGGVAVSYLHPDPVNNRYNNSFGPDEPMLRRDVAILLDRAFLNRPTDVLKVTVDNDYRDLLVSISDYTFASYAYRAGEVLDLIAAYRAAMKVANLPAGFSAATVLNKITAGADEILASYANDCYAGHDGDGTSFADGCPRFGDTENFDAGSSQTLAVLETARLLYEMGGADHTTKADTYWIKALWVVAHMNDDHRVTTPCVGWKGETGDGIKWNKSNRWAISNYLIYDIRSRGFQSGDGAPYEANAQDALACFKADLRHDALYRCGGGARCYDSANGPWWNAWHSDFHTTIMEDQGHANASALIVYYALYDQWDEANFSYWDLGQFRKHWEHRRQYSSSLQYQFDQYPDSDVHPGNRCSSPTLTSEGTCDQLAGSWDSQKMGAWIRWAAIYGANDFRTKVRDLSPNWQTPGGHAGPLELTAGAWALFGEVGSPRRMTF